MRFHFMAALILVITSAFQSAAQASDESTYRRLVGSHQKKNFDQIQVLKGNQMNAFGALQAALAMKAQETSPGVCVADVIDHVLTRSYVENLRSCVELLAKSKMSRMPPACAGLYTDFGDGQFVGSQESEASERKAELDFYERNFPGLLTRGMSSKVRYLIPYTASCEAIRGNEALLGVKGLKALAVVDSHGKVLDMPHVESFDESAR